MPNLQQAEFAGLLSYLMKQQGIIIGAGMAGLTTAIALRQHGITAHIYEWAPALGAIGAGIWMAPNAMQVFDRLGISDKVNEGGVPLNKIQVTDRLMQPILRTDQEAFRQRYGHTTTAIRRTALQQILLNEIPAAQLHLGKKCIRIDAGGSSPIAFFEDGSQAEADFVIAADGIHSAIRQQLFPGSVLRSKSTLCWRGIAPVQLQPQFKKAIIEIWARGIRFGFSEVQDNVVDWFAVQRSNNKDAGQIKARLLHLFRDFSYPVLPILEATEEPGIILNDICDIAPLPEWHQGKICLIGDAAHASTPYMGQGGCQGIEDAYVIAGCIARHDTPETAFLAFEKIRKQKADFIVRTSRKMGSTGYLDGAMALLRNTIIRAVPMKLTQKQFHKVYTLNY